MSIRPALYLRVSTNEQKADAQEGAIRDYCAADGAWIR